MKNTPVSLGDYFFKVIDAHVQSGRYGYSSKVMRAGPRLQEKQALKGKALQGALIAGEKYGDPAPLDSNAFLTRMRVNHGPQ